MVNRMVTCPMTSRDAKWSRSFHISIISSQNKRLQPPEILKMRLRIRNESYICRPCLGCVSVTILTNLVLQLKPAMKQQI